MTLMIEGGGSEEVSICTMSKGVQRDWLVHVANVGLRETTAGATAELHSVVEAADIQSYKNCT